MIEIDSLICNGNHNIYPVQLLHADGVAGPEVLGPNPPNRL